MLEFLFQKGAIKRAQKYINKLEPKVNIHLPEEIPYSSIGTIKKMAATVSLINGMEEETAALSDEALRSKTGEFKSRINEKVKEVKSDLDAARKKFDEIVDPDEKETLNFDLEKREEAYAAIKQEAMREVLPEAFAVVREVARRVLDMRHFDVQMLGGMVLNEGNIAEMTTGEGKTLVATLPAYLNALTGEGVHIVTVNDYLASRDCDWMGPVFEFLGLSVGVIMHDMMPRERQEQYACDIIYGTNNEFGFDYLRDNMVSSKTDMVQRPHHYAIVDEVDSILIDEARTPLIISGPAEESTDIYYRANEIAQKLKGRRVTEKDQIEAKYKEVDLSEGYDYLADEKSKSVSMTDEGEEKAAKLFGIDNLHEMETIEYRHHILQAIKAREFFKVDVDYVVKEGQVIIVDEFTGRLMPGRRWSDGLHQAVEAKEGIKIERENQTLATITFQNYFRLYEKLSGMTGTAFTEANEFDQIYELDVAVIPTNKPMQRQNYADAVYRSLREKFDAIVEEIAECHEKGQPVLVGTISIEKSEVLSKMLTQRGVTHKVLNAKYHEQEANIISQAGRLKAVTIATNMAGRGTDIVLGGNAEFLAKNLAEEKSSDEQSDEEKEDLVKKFISEFKEQCKKEHDEVIGLGGLHVIGTERHESRRIDNQLRGRQGRQGDPGASRFYVSLEDDLMRLFASDKIIGLMDKLGMEEGQALEHPWLTRAIENAQRRVEGHNFEIRKHLLEYDNVMNRQREVIYDLRRMALESTDIKEQIIGYIEETVGGVVISHLFQQDQEEMKIDVEGLDAYLKNNVGYELDGLKDELPNMGQEEAIDAVVKGVLQIYEQREQDIGAERMRHMERMLLLNTIDSKWKDHLYAMDQLKEGIGLRSFAQRDPLIEYKKEGFAMFESMFASIAQEVAEIIFKIQPVGTPSAPRGVFSSLPQQLVHDEVTSLSGRSAPQAAQQPQAPGEQQPPKPTPIKKDGPKVGRNDPCPCGSGKKYKKCCGR